MIEFQRTILNFLLFSLILILSLCVLAEAPQSTEDNISKYGIGTGSPAESTQTTEEESGVQSTQDKLSEYGIAAPKPEPPEPVEEICKRGSEEIPYGECSVDLPWYCCGEDNGKCNKFCSEPGELVECCNECDCPGDYKCNENTGKCKPKEVLVECIRCSPRIKSIDYGEDPLTQGRDVKFELELGECTASKIVLIVSTRRMEQEHFDLYWRVFNYPAMEEFSSIQKAFDSIETARGGTEWYTYMLFQRFAVDALVKEGEFTDTVEITLDFTEENLDKPFKAKRQWIREHASEFVEVMPELNLDEERNLPEKGFFEATREREDKFKENMNFKFAVKDKCDNQWKFTEFMIVNFKDAAAVPTPPDKICKRGSEEIPYGECSDVLPWYCCGENNGECSDFCSEVGELVECCNKCGCPAGYECNENTGKCEEVVVTAEECSFYGECSDEKPWYCCAEGDPSPFCSGKGKGELVEYCNECGCPEGKECNENTGKCEVPPQVTGDGIAEKACFIKVSVEYAGIEYETGETVSIDLAETTEISIDAKFWLSQEECQIEEGEYGFWGTRTFTGGRENGNELSDAQLQEMSEGKTVRVSGIELSDLGRFASSELYFGMKGSIKASGAVVFSPKNSDSVVFEFFGEEIVEGVPPTEEVPPEEVPPEEVPPVEELEGCEPCQSIVGCLACLDYLLIGDSFGSFD